MEATSERYEAPKLVRVGALHELTLTANKIFGAPSDFHYPNRLSFKFS